MKAFHSIEPTTITRLQPDATPVRFVQSVLHAKLLKRCVLTGGALLPRYHNEENQNIK